jgi:methionyl-tRNA formyltransferase
MDMRIVFMGASELGWHCCRTLLESGQEVAGILSIPKEFRISWSDRPVTNVRFKSFEDLSQHYGIPLGYVTTRMSDPVYRELLQSWKPDLLVVIGWYYMVPRVLRDLARLGAVGIHASLLPRYRGGAPLVWAMINGERETGISLFHFADGVDTGDVIAQRAFDIAFEDDIATVVRKSLSASLDVVREYVPMLAAGTAPRHAQDHSLATLVPQRKPEDGLLNWNDVTALQAYNWVRAQTRPYPGAFTFSGREKIILWKVVPITMSKTVEAPPGSIVMSALGASEIPGVVCADGKLIGVSEAEASDGQVMTGAELARKRCWAAGTVLGAHAPARAAAPGASHDLQ